MADKSMDMTKSARWALVWIPVLLVLSSSAWITDTIFLGGPYAIIPLAAWIGAAYKGKGFWAVMLGGLLLPLGLYLGPYSSGLHLDVYLVALLVCRMAASPLPLQDWVPRFDSKKLRVTAFVILPMTVVFYAGKLIGDLPLRLGFDLYGLFMLWLFAVGTAGRRATPMMIGLAVASVIGTALDMRGWPPQADVILEAQRAYLPVLGLSDLKHMGVDYGLNSPQGFLTGAGYFWSGRFIRRLWENGHEVLPSSWRACGWLSLASIFVLSNWDYFLFAKVLDWSRYEAFNVMGSPLALLLVGLMAGVLLGRYGIGLMVGLVVLFWGLNGLVLSGFDFARPHIVFRLQEIVYAVGFGALGVRLRDIALCEETFLFSRRWVWYTQKDAAQVRAGGVINRLVRSSSYLRCGVLVLTIALPLTLLIIDVYPRHGLWSEIKDFYEDNNQAPPIIRKIPLECRGDSANPYLWQAAMEYIGDKPLIEADPCGYSGKIQTG